jgi:hypothetical protein
MNNMRFSYEDVAADVSSSHAVNVDVGINESRTSLTSPGSRVCAHRAFAFRVLNGKVSSFTWGL